MKRILATVLMMVIIFSMAIACAADFSSMSDEQVKAQLDVVRNELVSRGLKAENKRVIVEQEGIQIYINGDIKVDKQYSWDEANTLYVPVVIINNTSHNINMLIENPSVNGWAVEYGYSDLAVPANKKAKTNLLFSLEDADVESLADFSDVEFTLRVFDDDSWKDLFKTKSIIIVAE